MQLDKRIKDIGAIMTCFSIEAAKEYLGQQGYFTNTIDDYQNLKFTDFGTLDRVDNDDAPFKSGSLCYQFFLPAAYVRPAEEKKWRPFTLAEFLVNFPVGTVITFRRKDAGGSITLTFIGYQENTGFKDICLGCTWYLLKELIEDYELKDEDGNWTPFGVEE